MAKFVPENLADVKSVEDLVAYLQRQNLKMQQVIDSLQPRLDEPLHSPPTKVFDGLQVVADGVDWNPGAGAGPYMFYNGAWHFMVSQDMPRLPDPPPDLPEEDPGEPPPPPPDTTPEVANIVAFTPTSFQLEVGNTLELTISIAPIQLVNTIIPISNTNPAAYSVPAQVTVPAGESFVSLTVQAIQPGQGVITATLNSVGHNVIATIPQTEEPPPPPPDEPPDDEEEPPPPPPPPAEHEPDFFHSFENSATEGGAYSVQSGGSNPPRFGLADVGRHGSRCVFLRTFPGDSNVAGSGSNERCDLTLRNFTGLSVAGDEEWWAHSFFFPNRPSQDHVFRFPISSGFMVFYQWHAAAGGTQPTYVILINPQNKSLQIRVNGTGGEHVRMHPFGSAPFESEGWYDFIEHFIWRPDNQGLTEVWARRPGQTTGTKVLELSAPNMYSGDAGNYLKPSNYHTAFGQTNTVYHDRIVRGRTPESVIWFPLSDSPI